MNLHNLACHPNNLNQKMRSKQGPHNLLTNRIFTIHFTKISKNQNRIARVNKHEQKYRQLQKKHINFLNRVNLPIEWEENENKIKKMGRQDKQREHKNNLLLSILLEK